jgi:hypothetical protein
MTGQIVRAAMRSPAGRLRFMTGAVIHLTAALLLLAHAVDYVRALQP